MECRMDREYAYMPANGEVLMNVVKKRKHAWVAHAAVSALVLGSAMPAFAQDATTDDAAEVEAAEIVVTGSRIRGIDPVGSNVIALDQAKIAEVPVTSTNDMLRRIPQVVSLGANRAGGSAQNGAANQTRGAGINLRGLSTNATLVLYDGKRLPPQGTQGQFTDPSVIPSIALGRMEVVADGASAIYGSDAVAGVVNMILRKDLNGVEARARYGLTEGNFREQQLALIGGRRWADGHFMIAGEFTKNNELFGSELDFYQNDNRDRGGLDRRNRSCAPGTMTVDGTRYAMPTGTLTSDNVGSLVANTSNLCFYGDQDLVLPQQERYSVVSAFSQEIGSGFRVFADGFFSYRQGQIANTPNINTTVTNANPFFVSPVSGATSVTIETSLIPTLGLQMNDFHAQSWNVVGGFEAQLFSDFKGTVYYSHGESEELADRRRSGVNNAAVTAALLDTNPETALNLFGGPNNAETLRRITDNLFVIEGRTRLDVFNAQADGSLFELPGGNVRIAVGAEHRAEYTYTNLTTGSSTAQTPAPDSGSRNVNAVFAEMFVPLVGSANAMAGIEQLSLSLALRHEDYSDFGSTTNPKFGITYKPFAGLTLRGTYGTSFRAPTFGEVSTPSLYFDNLPGANGNQLGIGIAGGNPTLKPETAKTWSFGIEAAPEAVPGLRASLTHFRIDYSNQIQALRGTVGLLTDPLYSSFVNLSPTRAEIDALADSGLPYANPINRDQVTFIADGRRHNLGTSLLRGLDFGLSYDWTMGDVRFDAGVQGTYVIDYLFETVPGSGYVDVLNTFGFIQKFRSQTDLGMQYGDLRGRLIWNHLSGYDNKTVTPIQKVSNYDTFDISVSYKFSDRLTLSADVRNLLNENPPFVDTPGGYDPQASNPLPRLFSVTAQVKF